ncbi:MAG TPA: 2OG-Fe(II) oxygenase [Rhizomicrobium sp.]|nr:2OG-Fe(II) oxygenase [Rhizomicrobium sp.]
MGETPILMEGGSVTWRGLFTPAQLDDLERYCDTLPLESARLTGSGTDGIRTTEVAWVYRNAQTEDLYLRMEAIVLRLNADLFHFALTGLTTMQYAVYHDKEAGYFDWHSDYGRYRGDPGQEPRKITLSLQLSDGASYDGCDLEVRAAHPIDVAARERGALMAFRANALHRVTPITRGLRKALVVWAAGPEFR